MNSSLYVKLTASDNNFITYPAYGLLEILEFGTTGSIIVAVFRQALKGNLGAAVEVRNPKFEYKPSIARLGHCLVAEFRQRQSDSDESRNYHHKVVEEGGEVLEQSSSRANARLFCSEHQLSIRESYVYPDKGLVLVHVRRNIGSKVLATIYAVLCNDEASTDDELRAHFQQTLGLTESQAHAQVARRQATLKAPL
jgi:hypothetical protein